MPYNKQSPGGSIFPYPYKGGELFGLHLGSYETDEEALLSMMKAEETFFLQQNKSIGMWIDLCGTRLSDRVIAEFIEYLQHICSRTLKLALVGCSFVDHRWINKRMKESGYFTSLPVKFFSDPEVAKTWIVSERY